MSGFKYGAYDVFPAAQQIIGPSGEPGRWIALASIVRWNVDAVRSVPVSWYPPDFDSEQAAVAYAESAVRDMIDHGRCKI